MEYSNFLLSVHQTFNLINSRRSARALSLAEIVLFHFFPLFPLLPTIPFFYNET